jgi:hypothetical protein
VIGVVDEDTPEEARSQDAIESLLAGILPLTAREYSSLGNSREPNWSAMTPNPDSSCLTLEEFPLAALPSPAMANGSRTRRFRKVTCGAVAPMAARNCN